LKGLKKLDFSIRIAISLFHQVSDKRLAEGRRAEATLSPQGGGRVKVRPRSRERRKAPEARGSPKRAESKGNRS